MSSQIKSLEDMRNTVKTIAADCDEEWILGCLDAIESEIAERFIELPTIANDVPIKPGNRVMLFREGLPRKIANLIYLGKENWLVVFDEAGGHIMLPDAKENVGILDSEETLETLLLDYALELDSEEGPNWVRIITKKYSKKVRDFLKDKE